jgi:hypothetical protein
MFLELFLLAAMILGFHVLSLAANPANLRHAFLVPSRGRLEGFGGEGLA